MIDERLFEQFRYIGRDIFDAGLTSSHGGNLSVRVGDRIIIKRRGAQFRRLKPEDFVETDWDTALELVSKRFAEVKKEHGSDAFALLASAKCTNEENYLFNKFTRQILATNTIDHCARL